MRTTRTFIAVDVSAKVRSRAAALIDRLDTTGVKVNWVAPSNMHITMKFLGDQTDQELASACQAVAAAAKEVTAFEFECHGAGAFPAADRPRTIWIGVREGCDALIQLHAKIDQHLADIGIARDPRAFHPHLTIGRVRSGGAGQTALGELVQRHHAFEVGTTAVDEVIVYSSQLDRSGPTYQILASAALDG